MAKAGLERVALQSVSRSALSIYNFVLDTFANQFGYRHNIAFASSLFPFLI